MAETIATFFQIIGVNPTPPSNMAELIPYMLTVFVGLVLVIGVFVVIGAIVQAILYSIRRY